MDPVFQAVKSGGPSVIFLLLFVALLVGTGQLWLKREITLRDQLIERQSALAEQNLELARKSAELATQQQKLFESALTLLREDVMPLLDREGRRGSSR